jgi:hypothetical protein
MRLAHLNFARPLTALILYLAIVMVRPSGLVLMVARLGVACLLATVVVELVGI